MVKSNSKYWSDRLDNIFSHLDQTDMDFFYQLQDIYSQYAKEIQKEIFSFYQQYAKDNNMSLADAMKKLRKEDLSDYVQNANRYRESLENNQQALDRLNEQYSGAQATRLEALLASVEYQLLLMNGRLQQSFWEYLKNVVKYVYKKNRLW